MVVIRRRLLFWLIKAYIKKNGKIIVLSFLLGLAIFFMLLTSSRYFSAVMPVYKKATIGIVGAYSQDNLPQAIVGKVSRGLTYIKDDGSVQPDIAQSWEELNNGKEYIFHLRKDQYFNNGVQVTSSSINYNFSDVSIERPDKFTLIFKLKDAYAPFLATVSRPVFDKQHIGTGDYRVEELKLNGNYVQSLTLVGVKNKFDVISYHFYPTEEALKMAFLLGEITEADDLSSPSFKQMPLAKFPNMDVTQKTDYSHLVTLFYNTTDSTLSDRKVRLALNYAIPDNFKNGERAYLPYAPDSIFYNKDVTPTKQDFEHAKLLLSSSGNSSGSATTAPTNLKITTLTKYRPAADLVAKAFSNLGIKTSIEETDFVPANFQIFLGDFNLSKDPDQYALWHSNQPNNITKYKNLRIDKLLEDGRKTENLDERKSIYNDFQKFLIEDAPASFLYFPYEYDVIRK